MNKGKWDPHAKRPYVPHETNITKKRFFENVAKKCVYLNPEIVEEVWNAVQKVVSEDLKKTGYAFLPNLVKLWTKKGITRDYYPNGLRYKKPGNEYYTIKTRVNYKLRRYFNDYLEKQKQLENLVPEKPPTLVK